MMYANEDDATALFKINRALAELTEKAKQLGLVLRVKDSYFEIRPIETGIGFEGFVNLDSVESFLRGFEARKRWEM